MAKPQPQQQVAKVKPAGEIAVMHDQLPEYLAQMGNKTSRGNEQVGTDDLVFPRLEVVQALSPCLKKSDPTYIEGSEQGMLFNNLTRELYGDEVLVMPIYFRKEYLIWVVRQKSDGSGGFRGSYATAELAAAKITELDEDNLQIVDTAQQFCLLVGNGRTEEIVISMAKSKLKVSRRWNSLIRLAGGDRWSRVYKLGAVEEVGKKGTFWNYTVEVAGFPTKPMYDIAAAKYDSIASGRVRADISGDAMMADDDGDGTHPKKGNDY